MIHRWLEEWFDTLLLLFFIFASLLFSFYFWKEQYQLRCTQIVIDEFLEKSCVEGKISKEEVELLLNQIRKIDNAYSVDVIYTGIELEPCYAKLSKEHWDRYYWKRNVRKEMVLVSQQINIPEEKIDDKLQEETNASLLAIGKEQYLPLPKEEEVFSVIAVRPEQRVYEGEELITLCLVTSSEGIYYVEAESIKAISSGKISMLVNVNDIQMYVDIDVICYPRELICDRGHTFANTKERIQQQEQTGEDVVCPVCEELPTKISCNTSTIYLKTGESLLESSLFLEVTYLDGHIEKIFPSELGWEDNYDSNFCGLQNVTIQYGQLQTMVVVISEGRNCEQCDKICIGKCFEDYIAFPYCTTCMSEQLLFTGEVYEELFRMNLKELVHFLEEEKQLFLKKGERVMVEVKKEKASICIVEKTVIKNRKVYH